MKRTMMLSFGCLVATWGQAVELEVRNVALVRAGHLINLVGTVHNTGDHSVDSTVLVFSVLDQNRVLTKESVQVPALEAGQAWRLNQTIRSSKQARVVQMEAHDLDGVGISVDARQFPGTTAQH